jgi:hypothetical protein
MKRTTRVVVVGALVLGAFAITGCSIAIGSTGRGSSPTPTARPAVTRPAGATPAAPVSPAPPSVTSPVSPSPMSGGAAYLALVGPLNTKRSTIVCAAPPGRGPRYPTSQPSRLRTMYSSWFSRATNLICNRRRLVPISTRFSKPSRSKVRHMRSTEAWPPMHLHAFVLTLDCRRRRRRRPHSTTRSGRREHDAEACYCQPQQHLPRREQIGNPSRAQHLEFG